MAIDSTKIAKVATAMNNKYEAKNNKKTTISGSYTGDNDSYPTVLACINKFGELVTSWSVSPSDTKYPSEKLVSDALDTKISKSQTAGFVKNDGTIDTNSYLALNDSGVIPIDTVYNGAIMDNAIDFAKFKTNVYDNTAGGTSGASNQLITSGAVYSGLSGKEDISNKVSSWNSTTNNTRYPTEKLVKDSLDNKLDASLPDNTTFETEDGEMLISNTESTGFLFLFNDIVRDVNNGTIHYIKDNHTPGSGNELAIVNDIPGEYSATAITDANANNYTAIGTLTSGATQQTINNAINTRLSSLASVDIIEWDTADANGKPSTTASASTMNKLYLIKATQSNDDNYNVFVTEKTGSIYSWEKIDSVTLDISGKANIADLATVAKTGSYADLSNKPSFTPTVTSSTEGAYKIGSINISGSSVDIYGVDTNTTYNVDAEINQALDDLAEAIYPTSS